MLYHNLTQIHSRKCDAPLPPVLYQNDPKSQSNDTVHTFRTPKPEFFLEIPNFLRDFDILSSDQLADGTPVSGPKSPSLTCSYQPSLFDQLKL